MSNRNLAFSSELLQLVGRKVEKFPFHEVVGRFSLAWLLARTMSFL